MTAAQASKILKDHESPDYTLSVVESMEPELQTLIGAMMMVAKIMPPEAIASYVRIVAAVVYDCCQRNRNPFLSSN